MARAVVASWRRAASTLNIGVAAVLRARPVPLSDLASSHHAGDTIVPALMVTEAAAAQSDTWLRLAMRLASQSHPVHVVVPRAALRAVAPAVQVHLDGPGAGAALSLAGAAVPVPGSALSVAPSTPLSQVATLLAPVSTGDGWLLLRPPSLRHDTATAPILPGRGHGGIEAV